MKNFILIHFIIGFIPLSIELNAAAAQTHHKKVKAITRPFTAQSSRPSTPAQKKTSIENRERHSLGKLKTKIKIAKNHLFEIRITRASAKTNIQKEHETLVELSELHKNLAEELERIADLKVEQAEELYDSYRLQPNPAAKFQARRLSDQADVYYKEIPTIYNRAYKYICQAVSLQPKPASPKKDLKY